MATPSEKLASSLEMLQHLQEGGRRVFSSNDFTRVHRERLLKHGFLQQVIKGWLISSAPETSRGDTTPWYASVWEFCARYCENRFGKEWHLSPELSILIHAEDTTIPDQVVIYSPHGTNNTIELLFGTSLYDLKHAAMPAGTDLTERRGLRLYSPAAALMKVSDGFLLRYPVEAQIVLAGIKDASELLRPLLEGGRSTVAGRLAGALRRIGRADVADEILAAMKAADYDVRESDPFLPEQSFREIRPHVTPLVGRIHGLWEAMRNTVIQEFPAAPGRPETEHAYLAFVEDIYQSDAYHSLSIEGYTVTPELIERVRADDWDPESRPEDREDRDALAARGYWQAFQVVRDDVQRILTGANPGALVRTSHREWYRELFQPFVGVGLIPAATLAGYRGDPVYLRGSRHVPPRAESLPDTMPVLFDLLEEEQEPSVRAVLGHWMVGYIHPYPDGNGRIARFLMNAMLASGGYPWTVIRVEDRDAYLSALEVASVKSDIEPFARFLAARVQWSVEAALVSPHR